MPIRKSGLKVAKSLALGAAFGAVFSLAACGEPTNDTQNTAAAQSADDDVELDPIPVMGEEVRILAFGDSLFAGYGLKDAKGDSYPAKLEAALRARGVNAKVTNAGFSGDTTAAGLGRIEFVLDEQAEKPDLFILELGGNDLLRGLSPQETRANFSAMLDVLKTREVPVLLMGMRAPPNLGPEYVSAFDAIYGDLAKEYDTALIPFWLESIYQEPQLFQSDRKHPTVEGIETLVGATVEQVAEVLPDKTATPQAKD
jgi:acyl-CoA thioesterase-1